jgi:hypothetical protein
MNFANLVAGDAVLVDANTLIYDFQLHPRWGAACTQLLQRIENQHLPGDASAGEALLGGKTHRPLTTSRSRSGASGCLGRQFLLASSHRHWSFRLGENDHGLYDRSHL